MNMPIIETERCILRALTLDDAEALNAVNRLPEVMRYIGPAEDNVEKTRWYLQKGPLADYEKFGYGRHACIDKSSGKLIGFCGIKYVRSLRDADIGYRLHPDYWGKGIATEISMAAMGYGKSTLGLTRILGLALPDNLGSINIFLKLGMHYEKNVMIQEDECVQYAWEAK